MNGESPAPQAATIITSTPKPRRRSKRPEHKSKLITGYIIYASEIRKDIIKKFPDQDFGYISKVVGVEWKNLPQETKVAYEKRAKEQNAKSKALVAERFAQVQAQAAASQDSSMSSMSPLPGNQSINNSTKSTTRDYMTADYITNGNSNLRHNTSSANSFNPNSSTTTAVRRTITATSRPLNATVTVNQNNSVNVVNKITYTKLKPKDAIVQTEPIKWVKPPPKKQIRFSEKFVAYLKNYTPPLR